MRNWIKEGKNLSEDIKTFLPPAKSVAVWHLGQCGEALKVNSTILLVDPVLSPILDAQGNPRTQFLPPFGPDVDLPIHAVFCTHNHSDHLQPATILGIAAAHPETHFYFPAGVKEETCSIWENFSDRVTFLRQGEKKQFETSDEDIVERRFTVNVIAQPHDQYKSDEFGNEKALGYIFDLNDVKVYHAGDTVATTRLVDEINALGFKEIHGAFLPVNGRDWVREARNLVGNMNAEEAAIFADLIHANILFPTHCDLMNGNLGNPGALAPFMDINYPDRPYHFLKPGEFYLLR